MEPNILTIVKDAMPLYPLNNTDNHGLHPFLPRVGHLRLQAVKRGNHMRISSQMQTQIKKGHTSFLTAPIHVSLIENHKVQTAVAPNLSGRVIVLAPENETPDNDNSHSLH